MKKLISAFLSLVFLFSLIAVAPACAQSGVSVMLHGKKLEFDVPPQIINGRTMVPLRKIFESLDATVDWDNATRTVTATRAETTIKLTIGKPSIIINGVSKVLDTAPCIVSGSTLVPARAVSEAFNLSVSWDANTRTVFIKNPDFASSFDKLKSVVISKGVKNGADNSSVLKAQGSDYRVDISYAPSNDMITYHALVNVTHQGVSLTEDITIYLRKTAITGVMRTVKYASGTEFKSRGMFPNTTGKYIVQNGTIPVSYSSYLTQTLNIAFTKMDDILRSTCGVSFIDLYMFYNK